MKPRIVGRRAFLALLPAGVTARLCAQGAKGVFTYERVNSPSAAAEVVTIHLPTGSSRTVGFVGATVYSSVACTFTIERNGVAPTATAGAASTDWGGGANVAAAVPYYASNVGSPTVGKTYNVAAGAEQPVEFEHAGLLAGQNLTIRTSSITGDVRIFFQWREF